MRNLRVFLALSLVLLAVAPAASAHLITVDAPGGGNAVHDHWVGGGPGGASIPGQGGGLFAGFFGPLPAAHGTGLVSACEALMETEAAASILAPGFTGTGCEHGD
jgi:hypothetical protein